MPMATMDDGGREAEFLKLTVQLGAGEGLLTIVKGLRGCFGASLGVFLLLERVQVVFVRVCCCGLQGAFLYGDERA